MDMGDAGLLFNLRGVLRHNEPMARHVTWRTGGAADRCYLPADLDDLASFLADMDKDWKTRDRT